MSNYVCRSTVYSNIDNTWNFFGFDNNNPCEVRCTYPDRTIPFTSKEKLRETVFDNIETRDYFIGLNPPNQISQLAIWFGPKDELSNSDKKAAYLTAKKFQEFFVSLGYNQPVAISSGNGEYYLLIALPTMSDDLVRRELTAVCGIGRWTADIYLLMALGRPDVWPRGDLALVKAVRDLKGLNGLPGADEFEALGEAWRPWRSVAARLLWNHYLNPE